MEPAPVDFDALEAGEFVEDSSGICMAPILTNGEQVFFRPFPSENHSLNMMPRVHFQDSDRLQMRLPTYSAESARAFALCMFRNHTHPSNKPNALSLPVELWSIVIQYAVFEPAEVLRKWDKAILEVARNFPSHLLPDGIKMETIYRYLVTLDNPYYTSFDIYITEHTIIQMKHGLHSCKLEDIKKGMRVDFVAKLHLRYGKDKYFRFHYQYLYLEVLQMMLYE